MLEPVAAVILNAVLSGRSHLERAVPLHSVVKIVQTTGSRSLQSDFFNPQPRRVKGKARGTASLDDEFEPFVLSSRCREWSVLNRNVSRRNQTVLVREASLSKERLHRRTGYSREPSISTPRSPTRAPSHLVHFPLQKRHVSQMTDIPANDTLPVAFPSSTTSEEDDAPIDSASAIEKFLSALRTDLVIEPNEVWSMYVDVEKADALSRLTVQQLLTFTDKVFTFGDANYASVELSQLFNWGERMRGLLSNLASRIAPSSQYDYWSKCAMARAAALMGQIDESLSYIHAAQKIPVDYQKDVRILWTYKTLLFYVYRYYDASHVLTMLAKEWLSVGSYLLKASGHWHTGEAQRVGAQFRKAMHRLVSRIPRPAELISSHFTGWGPELSKRIGELLIESYIHDQLPLHALDTLHQLKKLNVSIPLNTQLQLIRALVKEDTLGLAKDLFYTIPRGTTFPYYLQTALHLFAHCGDHRRAESYYDALHQQNVANELDRAMLMHSYGTQGQTEKVQIMFDDFFPIQSNGQRANSPKLDHFAIAIYACAKGGQIDAINYWLEELIKAGHSLNIVIYNTVMQAFARSGNMGSLRTVLQQLKESNTPPTVVTYVQLMTTLSHRKDIAGVEALYKEAVEEQGIVPNRRMVNALMNAHAMAGSWKGVIRAFDYIRSDSHPEIRLTIELYTTVIKAYVLIGAPFSVVSKIFSKLEVLNVKPDTHTFALLIQSACDAGEMVIASEIYHEMDKLASYRDSNVYIDVYILTIIMAGYLRAGKRKQAKAVYDEMVTRRIQPTAVTFSIMLTSYANQRSEEALKIAEAFIDTLRNSPEKSWANPPYGKPSALELVYGPVLKGYSALRRPEDVERLHVAYFEEGGIETLGTLTALFDVYRRTFQIDKVKEMWPAIFALGMDHVKDRPVLTESEGDPSASRLLNNILCVPLSMYIDALSAAGEHEEIARVWKNFQEQGFSFDAHNWNHLAVALIRAGQLERGFQIIENVILPYQDQARQLIASRNVRPKTPLIFNEDEEDFDPAVIESQSQLRRPASKRFPYIRRNLRQAMPVIEDEQQADRQDDIAWPMHVLHQISPAWNVWKVHRGVKELFLEVMENLREGYLPRPVELGQEQQVRTTDYLNDTGETRKEARDVLSRLYKVYPRTCALLHEFEGRERQRLGSVYDRKYEYGR